MSEVANLSLEKDYRVALRTRLHHLKHSLGKNFSTQNLAEECGVQRTYLSKVLNGGAHLNEDQLYAAMQFLKFSETENEYLNLLHQYQRSQQKNRKEILRKKIEEQRNGGVKADRHLSTKLLEKDQEDVFFLKYFLTPHVQLVHMLLTIEEFQKNPSRIREVLEIEDSAFQEIIERLFQLQLISQQKDRMVAERQQVFLSSSSDLFEPYHLAAKTQALSRLKKLKREEKNSTSLLMTCSRESWLKVRSRFVEFMKEIEQVVVADENPTGVYQLSVDLFAWSEENRK